METIIAIIFMFAALFSGDTNFWIAFAICIAGVNLDNIWQELKNKK